MLQNDPCGGIQAAETRSGPCTVCSIIEQTYYRKKEKARAHVLLPPYRLGGSGFRGFSYIEYESGRISGAPRRKPGFAELRVSAPAPALRAAAKLLQSLARKKKFFGIF
jgi:hypothetical protein